MDCTKKKLIPKRSWTMDIPENKKGLSGSTLKLIAVVSMLIDHFGASVFLLLMQLRYHEIPGAWMSFGLAQMESCYEILRNVGRLAFPIYCFLLIEGVFHTGNKIKYIGRLLAFALISEIPFDLAIYHRVFSLNHQNVFFELALGVLTICLIQKAEEKVRLFFPVLLGITAISSFLAEILHFDYGWFGIVCITLLYLTAETRINQVIVGAFGFAWEITAPLAFLLVWFYNGKRGMRIKYLFYVVYPAHLAVYALLCMWIVNRIGLNGYFRLI